MTSGQRLDGANYRETAAALMRSDSQSQREAPDYGAGASAWDPLILSKCGGHFVDIPPFL